MRVQKVMGSSSSALRKPAAEGVIFPTESTTESAKRIWSAAAAAADPSLASLNEQEPNWRHSYSDHLLQLTTLAARDPGTVVAVAEAGIRTVYDEFRFARGSDRCPMRESLQLADAESTIQFETISICGDGAAEDIMPLGAKAKKWAEYGCCEPR